jgi:hypothetical protein
MNPLKTDPTKNLAAALKVSDQHHHHGDHTGGDAVFHKVGHSLQSCVCGKGHHPREAATTGQRLWSSPNAALP